MNSNCTCFPCLGSLPGTEGSLATFHRVKACWGAAAVSAMLHCAIVCVCACVHAQVFARASKFSLFDPAKEMVYIEMDADEKKQGKAAVDLVGSQVGGLVSVG